MFAIKEGSRQDGEVCLEMEDCHIILRVFWRFLMMHRKKNLDVFIFSLLTNTCATKQLPLQKDEMIAINSIGIVIFWLSLRCPTTNFGPLLSGSLFHLMLIAAFLHIWPEGHCEPCYEVGSQCPDKRLVWFELGALWFYLQCLNPPGHSPWTQC